MVRRRVCTVLIAAAIVSGCSFAPPYQVPPSAMPSAFKEAGGWQLAEPADHMPRGEWWTVYRDPVLDELESKVAGANPDLAAAIARHDQAQAYLDQARAGLFPTIGAYSQFSRSRQSDDRPLRGANQPALYNSATVDVGLNYDLDLWGKVRNEVAAGKAAEQASQYDIESLRLSLQAKPC